MDLTTITPDELEAMEVRDLRKLARANKVKNYLRLDQEALINLLLEKALELLGGEDVESDDDMESEVIDDYNEEDEDEDESDSDEVIEGAIENHMETGKHNPNFNKETLGANDDSIEEKAEKKVAKKVEKEEVSEKKEEKKAPKKAPKKKEKKSQDKKKEPTPNSESKSARVREITRELISSGRDFTSGHVMVQLKDRYDMEIHRSFVSGLIKKVRDEVEAENAEK